MTGLSPTQRSPRSRLGTLLSAISLVAALALGVVGVRLVAVGAAGQPARPAPLPSQPYAVDPASLAPIAQPSVPARLETGRPVQVSDPAGGCALRLAVGEVVIPSLCTHGRLVGTSQQPNGALTIPSDVHEVGLWDKGASIARPDGGAVARGTTLLAGHVDSQGQGRGALYDLYRLKAGALVYVVDANGYVSSWRVSALQAVLKAKLPAAVFAGPAGPRRLAIVTCGGPVEHVEGVGNTYRDNVIATAVPLS
jgi:sortase family protein